MKFLNLAQLCLAAFDFEAHIMLNFLRYWSAGLPVWKKKFNSNVAAKSEFLFSDYYWFINLVERENIALVLLRNAYYSSGLIKFKEKISS